MDRRDRNRRKKARQLARAAERERRRRPKRRGLTAAKLYRIIEPAARAFVERLTRPGPWASVFAAETCPCCDKKPLKLSDAIGPYDAETALGLFNVTGDPHG